jgi:hypothetical protein
MATMVCPENALETPWFLLRKKLVKNSTLLFDHHKHAMREFQKIIEIRSNGTAYNNTAVLSDSIRAERVNPLSARFFFTN